MFLTNHPATNHTQTVVYNAEVYRMIDNNLEEKNKAKRRNAPLTQTEKLTFFFLPFFNRNPFGSDDELSENELERFKKHGFENKYYEALRVKRFGLLFWSMVMGLVVIAIIYFKNS